MDTPPPLGEGTVIGGDFRIDRPLQAGGMGAVYVAEQLSTAKPRALKLMHPQLVTDPKSRQRFVEEARVGAKIPSDHVVEVVGAGVDDATGMPYLAMELLDGEDLASVIERSGPLPASSARELMLQLGHAIGAAHAQGIVHRDLKPENVFIAKSRRRGEQLTVKVLDFGIAKTLESSRTAATATAAMGSPLFMAPEQATPGAPVRAATDVWALGLIAFHALSGTSYWRSAAIEPFSLQSLLAEVLVHPLVPATQRAAELGAPGSLPAGFDDWFARCAAREPGQRYAEANACIEAFDAMLRGEPGSAWSHAPAAFAATAALSSAAGSSPGAPPPGAATPPHGGFGTPPPSGTPPHGGFGTPAPQGGWAPRTGATPPPRGGTVPLAQAEASSGGSLGWLPIAVGALVTMMVLTGALVFGMYWALRPEPTEPVVTQNAEPLTTPEAPPSSPAPQPPPIADRPPEPASEPPEPEPPEPEPPEPEPASEPPEPEPPEPEPERRRAPDGRLSVNTTPYSRVTVDGEYLGSTPVVNHRLRPGSHEVLLESRYGQRETRTVRVRAGRTTRISFSWPRLSPRERPTGSRYASPSRDSPSRDSSLPATPSRSDTSSTMRALRSDVIACGRGRHGVAFVRVVFSHTGRVQNVSVTGNGVYGPIESCIAGAVRSGARVPPFRNDTYTVTHPYRF